MQALWYGLAGGTATVALFGIVIGNNIVATIWLLTMSLVFMAIAHLNDSN